MYFYPTNGHRRYEMSVDYNVFSKFNDEDFSQTRFNTDPLAQEWARRCTNHLTKAAVRAMADNVCLRLGLTKEQLAALGPPRISQQKFEDGSLSCLYTVDYMAVRDPQNKDADDVVTISLAIFGHVPGGKIVQYYQNLEQPFAKIPIPPDYKQQYDEWMDKQK